MASTSNSLNPIDFERRQITVNFDIMRRDGTEDALVFDGMHRMRATMSNAGMNLGRDLNLIMEGLSLRDMNRLSYIRSYSSDNGSNILYVSPSTVTVRAGIRGQALSTIFIGQIYEAYVDYASAPDVVFRVSARDVGIYQSTVGQQLGFRGPLTPVAILSDICARNNLTLDDHGGWGPKTTLNFSYLNGDPLMQIRKVIAAARGHWSKDSNNSLDKKGKKTSSLPIIHVWGPYASRGEGVSQNSIPIVSSDTGMIGYPLYSTVGCNVSSIFRPELTFYSLVNLKSKYLPAAWEDIDADGYNAMDQPIQLVKPAWDGYWMINNVTHDLSCEVPNGPWFTHLECVTSDYLKYRVVK